MRGQRSHFIRFKVRAAPLIYVIGMTQIYSMITHALPIDNNLPIKTLVTRQQPTDNYIMIDAKY